MTVRAVLDRARARHDAMFADLGERCRAERVTGRVWNDETTSYEPTTVVLLPSGTPCRLKSPTTAAETVSAGDQAIVERLYELDLSWDVSPPLDVEDVVILEVSDDAWAIGRPLTVIAVGLSGSTSCRRVIVQDRTGAAPPPETVSPPPEDES